MPKNNLAKKLIELGLDEEKVLKIVESYRRRIERVKQYQKEKYYKVSITLKKEQVEKIKERFNVDIQTAKKLAALEKLKSELKEWV
jgi:hypothetical protein